MRKHIAAALVLILLINMFACISVQASSIIFCDIDFENSANPFGGIVRYDKGNSITVGGNESNHYAVISKVNGSDCHMDYRIEMSVDNLVAEADFSFGDIGSVITPFYFIGVSSDGKTRADMDAVYVGTDRKLHLAYSPGQSPLYTFEKNVTYRISLVVRIPARVVDIYVNGNKLAEKQITDSNFNAVKSIRNWIRTGDTNSDFTMDNYRIYEADKPSAELPDVWESVFPDDGKDRIQASEIKQIFSQRETGYPRLFAAEADFNDLKISSDKAVWYKKVKQLADSKLSDAVPKYELADGYRLLPVSREVLKRMQLWGFMYRMTQNTKYSERAMRDLDTICNFADWHPEHFLDTAEMMTAAAIGYDWFYDAMTDAQREKLADAIVEKGLKPTRMAYYGRLGTGGVAGASMNFVMASDNMNIVDNCAAIIAASAVFEKNKDLCSDVIEKAIRSLAYSLSGFAPDGAWEEGVNYCVYSAEYITRAVIALDNVFGSDFGISEYEGLSKTAQWIISLDSYKGVNSYHDTWDGMHADTFALAGLGKIYSDNAVLKFRRETINQMDYMPSVFDLLWCDKTDTAAEPANNLYSKKTETVSIRESWFNSDGTINSDGLFFSTHGGRNDSYHSHVDAGVFVFDILGERWAMDIPPEDYNLMYGKDYGTYYRRRAEGHNTVVINPDATSSYVTDYRFSDKDAYAVYDMSDVYRTWASAYKRGFYVGDNKRSLTIRDEITLKNSSQIYWFMHTKANIEPTANGAILTQNGKKLKLEVKSNCSLKVSKADAKPLSTSPNPSQTANDGIYKVAIELSGSGNVTIEVKLSPYGENVSAMMNCSTSLWRSSVNNNTDQTIYDFEDYSSGLPSGFTEINPNNVTNVKPADSAFGLAGRSLWIAQAKTATAGSDQWYQLRAMVKPVNKRYQYIHYEQGYDNQFCDRWLMLKFFGNIETNIPLYRFTRADDMSNCFKVSNLNYGVQPVNIGWNSYDVVVDMQNKTYDVYVNNVLMGKDMAMQLKKSGIIGDYELAGIDELQFGINHQWDSATKAFASTSTYIDNIVVTPIDKKPVIADIPALYCTRGGITCDPKYADSLVYKPGAGVVILAKYDSENNLTEASFNKNEITARLFDGEKITLFNWNNIKDMKPLNKPIEFGVKYN